MHDLPARRPADKATLRQLATIYLQLSTADEQVVVGEQICALLGCTEDEAFDLGAWARDLLGPDAIKEEASWLEYDSEAPMIGRAGAHTGVLLTQWTNARGELCTALELHPHQRVVVPDSGLEILEHKDIVATAQQELAAAVTRARFLGLEQVVVALLCEEALAASNGLDYRQLWDEAYRTPTLGDGEGVSPLVKLIGVEVLDGYRVRLTFDDGVSRTLNLELFLDGPAFTSVRKPAFFMQLRIADGTLRWPNGAVLAADVLRYFLALTPEGEAKA